MQSRALAATPRPRVCPRSTKRSPGFAQLSSGRIGDLVETVVDLRRKADRSIARNGPRRRRPDHRSHRRALRRAFQATVGDRLCPTVCWPPSVDLRPETSPTPDPRHNPRTRPRPRRARSSPPPTTSPASSRDRACRSPRTSSARARSAPRPDSSWCCSSAPSRRRRRGARTPRAARRSSARRIAGTRGGIRSSAPCPCRGPWRGTPPRSSIRSAGRGSPSRARSSNRSRASAGSSSPRP